MFIRNLETKMNETSIRLIENELEILDFERVAKKI